MYIGCLSSIVESPHEFFHSVFPLDNPPADDIKRALEAHLVSHPDLPKKPTVSVNNTVAGNNAGRKRKRDKNVE
jgi:hypothetical protein